MKKNQIILAAALVCAASLSAQDKKYPEPEGMRPGMTEFWTPQPKVVTPGDIKTNTAPSDAIVLFDGKDLSAWQNSKGEAADWIVKNGVITVDKTKGDILTRQKFGSFQLHIEWCVPTDIEGESIWYSHSFTTVLPLLPVIPTTGISNCARWKAAKFCKAVSVSLTTMNVGELF